MGGRPLWQGAWGMDSCPLGRDCRRGRPLCSLLLLPRRRKKLWQRLAAVGAEVSSSVALGQEFFYMQVPKLPCRNCNLLGLGQNPGICIFI